MPFNPEIHHRQSIRLRHYDYATAGFYFVTICVQGRENLFGEIVDGRMVPNDAGERVETWWMEMSNKYPTVELDAYVRMPNHFHGIVILHPTVGADRCVRPESSDRCVRPGRQQTENEGGHEENKGGHAGPPLPKIIQWFKTMTTNAYIHGVNTNGWPPFPGRLWQRNYYERVIRNETELNNARRYIADNPARWAEDEENPANRANETP